MHTLEKRPRTLGIGRMQCDPEDSALARRHGGSVMMAWVVPHKPFSGEEDVV